MRVHNGLKNEIVEKMKFCLSRHIDKSIIFGSFVTDCWNPSVSDIDLICIDNEFYYYPDDINVQFAKKLLMGLPHTFDILAFTPHKFNYLYLNDDRFKKYVEKGVML